MPGKEEKNTFLFYAAFFLMVFAKAFGLNRLHQSYSVMFIFSAALLGFRVLVMKPDIKTIIKIGLLLLPSALIFLFSRETTLLFTCLFIAASGGVDFEKTLKWSAGIYSVAVPLKILLYFLGLVEGGSKAIYTNDSMGKSYLVGYTYGYGYDHPNMLFSAAFVGVLLLLYVNRKKLGWGLIGLCSLIMAVIFAATRCRTGLLVYLAILPAFLLLKCFPQKEKLLKGYCLLLIMGSFAIGILFPLIYEEDNLLMMLGSKMLSARPRWAHEAMQSYPLTLFGGAGVFLDILYIDVLMNCGIAGFSMLIVGIILMLYTFYRDNNLYAVVCVTALVLYACMEQFPLNIAMNPFILSVGIEVLFKEKSQSVMV